MNIVNNWFFKRVDNSALIVFRLMLGTLLMIESFGAIATGWIHRAFIAPKFTITFIGFEFLQPLPGNGMIYYYVVMGIFAMFIMLGFKYKFSTAAFTLLWTCTYLMQKSSYNNHYYLVILIGIFMLIVPANRYASLDVLRKPSLRKISMPRWVLLFIILQLWIVYTFSSVAKIYPDWLNYRVPEMLMSSRSSYPIVGPILQKHWAIVTVTYFGILFDLTFIPLLLWKKTRLPIFFVAIFFHLFNSIVFRIGIFPYLSLAFCLFFFSAEMVHRRFLWKKTFYTDNEVIVPSSRPLLVSFFSLWFLIQFALPLRHYFIKDNVLWTEEGHRLSWRMMLRSRSGHTSFKLVNKTTGTTKKINLDNYLSKRQTRSVKAKPDMLWQFCQHVRKKYEDIDQNIEIYVDSKISINGKKHHRFIDPNVDMAHAPWNYFFHNDWILPSPKASSADRLEP